MFCTECGQAMADEAKFCAFCGTRRSIAAASGSEVQAPAAPPRVEASTATAPAPVRTIRSTAEIMPMRVRPAAPTTPVEQTPAIESERNRRRGPLRSGPRKKARRRLCTCRNLRLRAVFGVSTASACCSIVCCGSCCASIRLGAVRRRTGIAGVVGARRKTSPVLIGAIVVALIALAGIFWMVRSSMSIGGKSSAPVAITIFPTSQKRWRARAWTSLPR